MQTKPEHLFVKNPLSGKLVNILPLFELMSQDELNDGPVSVIEKIQEVHDYLSTNVPKSVGCQVAAEDWAGANYWLVLIRKTFERMKEVPA
jgi:hypothetical protein